MPKSPLPFEEEPENEPNRSHRASRHFFAVLALCLIAIGGVAASTFSDALKAPTEDTTVTTVAAKTTVRTTEIPVAAPTVKSTAVVTTTVTAPTEPAPLVALPLNGVVLTPYSEQPLFNETMADYRAHPALDLDGEEDQPVRAIAEGTVETVIDDPLWGGCLTIDHGEGLRSIYRGIRSTVTIGAHLETGHELGKLAAVPCEAHLGPHLHFELTRQGQPIDPAVILGELLPSADQ